MLHENKTTNEMYLSKIKIKLTLNILILSYWILENKNFYGEILRLCNWDTLDTTILRYLYQGLQFSFLAQKHRREPWCPTEISLSGIGAKVG